MGDRYRYHRPRSPKMYDPARASLPTSVGYGSSHEEHHLHAIPTSRREIIPAPRSSGDRVNVPGPVTTTTYKIKADPPSRSSSIRNDSRTRRSTLDSSTRPTIVTASPRHRPTIHGGSGRPSSPMMNPYRSSDEGDYYSVPASSSKHRSDHRKTYSATMDNADMNHLARERDGAGGLRVGTGREGAIYAGTRARPIYPGTLVRHADTVADDYGDNGYGYTNPRDLVQYDLSNNGPRHHQRRDSFEGSRTSRPSSITGYSDIVRSYDPRERGPPPSTRGFDKIPNRASIYDPPPVRMPVPPMDPMQRPARVDPPFDPEPQRRSSSRRPVSLYQDREPKRPQRDEYYDLRDDNLRDRHDRSHRNERYDDGAEQRGFNVRSERPDRPERSERPERTDKPERTDRLDHDDRSGHKGGRDALATSVSLTAGALGLGAVARNTKDDDRDDRDDRDDPRRRRDVSEESRRWRDRRDDREPVDLVGRDPKERHSHRDKDDRDAPLRDRDIKVPIPPKGDPGFLDLSGRDPKERPVTRDERDFRDGDTEPRERRKQRSEAPMNEIAIDSRDDSSVSDDAVARRPRRERPRKETGAAAHFNPKDTMDLKALKEQLASQDSPAVNEAVLESIPVPIREPIHDQPLPLNLKDPRELGDVRAELSSRDDRSRRDPLGSMDRKPRVVSPPREKPEDKPVKSILRQPREKFPEDPFSIREGVAPLKDAKKDGIPPDARWTKISRKLVNPEALAAGKERYEARDDFVIVLRVLSREEVQAYATATQQIRAAREEEEERKERKEREERRRARRERHERHKRERNEPRRHRHGESHSDESDSTDDDEPKMLEGPAVKPRRTAFDGQGMPPPVMSGGISVDGGLRENPEIPGQYLNYMRNPPLLSSSLSSAGGRKEGK